jgi:hypothetical protein
MSDIEFTRHSAHFGPDKLRHVERKLIAVSLGLGMLLLAALGALSHI